MITDVLSTVVGVILPVFALVAVGYAYTRHYRPDFAETNQLNMTVFLPALILYAILDRAEDFSGQLPLAFAGALIIAGSGLLALPVCRFLKEDWRTVLPPTMFNNAGNLAIPLMVLTFGEEALPAAVVLFLVQTVGQFLVSPLLIGGRLSVVELLRMPMLQAALLGAVLATTDVSLPGPVMTTLEMAAAVGIPLLLVSLGARLASTSLHHWRLGAVVGVLCPATSVVVMVAIAPWFALDPMQEGVLFIFAVLPPAVMSYVIAEQFRQEPEKVASIVIVGTLMSALTLPLAVAYVMM
ncbi:AEC family transporter [Aquisalimonas sp.]|uniref:AEC family transporter n=1 Tax=unclassified Aquisalimonas TaxID=2644645 RepID=UPI0025BD0A2B|nr:AEC family transporter [Aquisalimonas sp.]